MKGLTHERIAKMLFPDLDRKMIENVNRAIDTPQAWMPENGPVTVPGLSYRGHRKQGHDLLTAGMLGFQQGGPAGVKAAWTHLMMDAMRDQMVRTFGYEGADVVEALFNYNYSLNNRRRRNGF